MEDTYSLLPLFPFLSNQKYYWITLLTELDHFRSLKQSMQSQELAAEIHHDLSSQTPLSLQG